jgi:hypothetical protein
LKGKDNAREGRETEMIITTARKHKSGTWNEFTQQEISPRELPDKMIEEWVRGHMHGVRSAEERGWINVQTDAELRGFSQWAWEHWLKYAEVDDIGFLANRATDSDIWFRQGYSRAIAMCKPNGPHAD